MNTYDWIVVGAGITGSALAYELARQGLSVLLIDQHSCLQGSTRFGYGGVAFWAGTTDLTQQLCAESITLYRTLTDELEPDPQFREIDLLLTIPTDTDPASVSQSYSRCAIPPQLMTVEAACQLEPLLNPAAIAGALTTRHGYVLPETLAAAYTTACQRLGGTVAYGQVTHFERQGDRITGVSCDTVTYSSHQVVICAGALSRALLQGMGVVVPLYFTHAELIETPPLDLRLQTLIMPAVGQRSAMEIAASRAEMDPLWHEPGHEPAPAILDTGVAQIPNGNLRIGQISRVLTDPHAPVDAIASEQALRQQIGQLIPALQGIPGTWHHCLVAFTHDQLPLIGDVPELPGVYLFSGFSNPLAIIPAVARRFAQQAIGQPDPILAQMAVHRLA